jgi:hypothetical protein
MSKRVSLLDKVQKVVDDVYKDSDNNIALFAVELDETGYPLGRMQKVKATPGCALGALSMIEEAVLDAKTDTMKKIDLAGDLSDKMTDLFRKLGIEDVNEMEEKLGKATDPEVKRQLTELLRKIKRNF